MMENNEFTLATEMLKEQKANARRWFAAFLVVLVLWFATIGVFVWYISLPVEEYGITQESEDNGNNQIIGGDYSVNPTESDV